MQIKYTHWHIVKMAKKSHKWTTAAAEEEAVKIRDFVSLKSRCICGSCLNSFVSLQIDIAI